MGTIDLNYWWAKFQFDTEKRLRAFNKISVMLNNGVQVQKVLSELYDRASQNGRKPNEGMAIVYKSWRNSVLNGGRLCDAVDGWIPYGERMIIQAGEDAGKLPENLVSLVRVVKSGRTIVRMVRNNLAYPIIVFGVTAVFLYVFGVKVVPEFARMSDPSKWHGAAKTLYLLSQVVQAYGILALTLVVSFLIGIILSLPRLTGELRVILDRFPPFSVYRLVQGSGFLLALAALLHGGRRVQDAFATLSESASPYLKERLDGFLLGVNSGRTVGDAMLLSGYDFPSKEIIDDLTVYAEHSQDFSAALEITANEWLEDGLATIETQLGLLTGVAIFMLTALIALIVVGFFGMQSEITAISNGAMR